MERRMYFFVPYNISDIQKGIQAGHAALEYATEFGHTYEYGEFIEHWKTWIILNGGTTNSTRDLKSGERVGSLDRIQDTLESFDIPHSIFKEPDLNNALSAVCFLADECVFNWKDYPDYESWAKYEYGELETGLDENGESVMVRKTPTGQITEDDVELEYCDFVGGKTNKILKDLIYRKPLA